MCDSAMSQKTSGQKLVTRGKKPAMADVGVSTSPVAKANSNRKEPCVHPRWQRSEEYVNSGGSQNLNLQHI